MTLPPSSESVLQTPNVLVRKSVSSSTRQNLIEEKMNVLRELTGIRFFAYDRVADKPISTGGECRFLLTDRLTTVLTKATSLQVTELGSEYAALVVPIEHQDLDNIVAIGYVCFTDTARPAELVLAAAENSWPKDEFDGWLNQIPTCAPDLLNSFAKLLIERLDYERLEDELNQNVCELDEQLEHTYEEITFLHRLTSNLHISKSPTELARLCLDGLDSLVNAESHVFWFDEKVTGDNFLVHGDFPLDELGVAKLVAHYDTHDWSKPLVRNNLKGTALGNLFPGINNFVLVPIKESNHCSGWILSCNIRNGEEYGTIEASLLKSLATIFGTHLRNIQLYEEIQQLILSFVRSLVSTLDAKDPYTRGHSERVALVARRLGAELGLTEDELHNIYLSGLLHDLGKIGVDDRVLRKDGALDDEERDHIQQHPLIGYTILKGLKNLKKVLPGVRSHHESFDGRGYPDGLIGDQIPLMARILAVADSFDAMGSDRPYRSGMSIERIESIFSNGSGKQWDDEIISAYFSAKEDIMQICEDYSLDKGIMSEEEPDCDTYV